MKRLIPLALALTALAAPVKAQYATDTSDSLAWTVAAVGAYQCSASEGLMTVEEAVKASFDYLAKRRNLEPYQVKNLMKTEGFWPAVHAFQKRHGGCPSIAAGIKRKAQQMTKPSPIY